MTTRILLLLLALLPVAACGEGGGGARADGRAQFDTAMGFRLGMLFPEARAAAARRGEELFCRLATTDRDPSSYPDSLWRAMGQTEFCDNGSSGFEYELEFVQGSLRGIEVGMGDDWDFIPVDTLVGRLTSAYGKPRQRTTYSTGGGRAEQLVWWSRKGDPAWMSLRCPDGATAGSCTVERGLFPPEELAEAR